MPLQSLPKVEKARAENNCPPDFDIDETERRRLFDLRSFERERSSEGYQAIAGVDEAGRGPLAGPVVAACCLIPQHIWIPGIDDSKRLTPKARSSLFEILTSHAGIAYGIGIVSSGEIDRINILEATKVAMCQAVENLTGQPDFLFIDGLNLPFHPIPNQKIVQGDNRCYAIAAASIIAKETRDRLMLECHHLFPQYGFDQHKGYGTEKHRKAISEFGPCPIHRMTFEPLKSLCSR